MEGYQRVICPPNQTVTRTAVQWMCLKLHSIMHCGRRFWSRFWNRAWRLPFSVMVSSACGRLLWAAYRWGSCILENLEGMIFGIKIARKMLRRYTNLESGWPGCRRTICSARRRFCAAWGWLGIGSLVCIETHKSARCPAAEMVNAGLVSNRRIRDDGAAGYLRFVVPGQ